MQEFDIKIVYRSHNKIIKTRIVRVVYQSEKVNQTLLGNSVRIFFVTKDYAEKQDLKLVVGINLIRLALICEYSFWNTYKMAFDLLSDISPLLLHCLMK